MSWLTGIAGRAEALLDRMDQAAATSIQSTGLGTPQRGGGTTEETTSRHHTSLSYEPTASVAAERPLSVPPKTSTSVLQSNKTASYSPVARPEAPPKTTPTPSSYNAYSKSRSSEANEDSIFQFLNTPSKQPATQPQAVKKTQSNPQIAQPDETVGDPYSNTGSWAPVGGETWNKEGSEEREEENTPGKSNGERFEEEAGSDTQVEVGEDRETESVMTASVSSEGSPAHSQTESQETRPEEEGVEGSRECVTGVVERGGGREEGLAVSVVQNQPKVGGGRKDGSTEKLEHQLVSLTITRGSTKMDTCFTPLSTFKLRTSLFPPPTHTHSHQ